MGRGRWEEIGGGGGGSLNICFTLGGRFSSTCSMV